MVSRGAGASADAGAGARAVRRAARRAAARDVGEQQPCGGAGRQQNAAVGLLAGGGKKELPPISRSPLVGMSERVKEPLLLVNLVPAEVAKFVSGGLAGAFSKSLTAPLDRVKILLQTVGAGTEAAKTISGKGGILGAFVDIYKSEGIKAYWKGNIPQVVRVLPYSATQLWAYDVYKGMAADHDGRLPVWKRLIASACAGMTATFATYPLDIVRLRLAVDPAAKSMGGVIGSILRDEGPMAFYKGLVPSMAGIAPYIAVNFTTFDLLKESNPAGGSFANAFIASTIATSICYPLDTVRRQMQLKTSPYKTMASALVGIFAKNGIGGFYRGWLPNLVKNMPNSSIRLASYDGAKDLILAAGKAEARAEARVKASNK